LDALTTKPANYSQMIPKEYRHESHIKRVVHNACIGEIWASNLRSRAAAEPTWTHNTICGKFATGLQKFNEEQAAKRMFVSRKAPTIPTIMCEEKVRGTSTRPMSYGNRPLHSKHDTVQRKKGPGPLSRCRGCGSPDHWLRDGKCTGKDVAQFIKRRLSNSQSPAQVIHELCFEDSEGEDIKNKNEDSPNQSELCANFVVTEEVVPPNDDTTIYETLVARSARHQISEHMDRTDETEVDSVFLQG
jgi:hypothetical protein